MIEASGALEEVPMHDNQPSFEDENLIIEAIGAGNVPVQFRIHGAVVARHSEVFATTISLPQSTGSEEEKAKTWPIVRLADDARDVEYMLRELYGLR